MEPLRRPSGTASPTPRWARSAGCARTSSAASARRSACGRSTRPWTPAPPSSRPRTPYHYSSYDEETEVAPRERRRSSSSAAGPNRIGQGIEFDYSCVHASPGAERGRLRDVMVNCNPETVSTDYDTSDRLYFEPLTLEDVLEIVHAEEQAGPIAGVICQLGGQTPLGLAQGLDDAGVKIVGTSPEAIHLAEERGAFGKVLADAGLPAPKHGMASTFEDASGSPTTSATRCWCARRTSWAAAAWRSSTTTTRSAPTSTRHRDQPRAPRARRPLHRRRGRDRRRRALRRPRAVPRRRDGAHRGGRHPQRRLVVRAAADHAGGARDRPDPARHRGDRARASGSAG